MCNQKVIRVFLACVKHFVTQSYRDVFSVHQRALLSNDYPGKKTTNQENVRFYHFFREF